MAKKERKFDIDAMKRRIEENELRARDLETQVRIAEARKKLHGLPRKSKKKEPPAE